MSAELAQILIVDNTESLRLITRQQITQLGFSNIEEAGNAEEAWKVIENKYHRGTPIRMVISNWTMPGMSGLELLKKMRKTYHFKNLPFVMLTAQGDKEKILMALKNGVNGIILRPFSPQDLQSKIQEIWKKYYE